MPIRNLKSQFSATSSIANGATVGDAVDVGDMSHGVVMAPTGFDGTAINWDVSNDGSTWYRHTDSTTISATQAADIPAGVMACRHIRPVAATSQTGAVTLELALSH